MRAAEASTIMPEPSTPPDAGDECERAESPRRESIHSLPALRVAREANPALWRAFQTSSETLPAHSTATLITRIETTSDPLLLWEIHLELERRGIHPIFRHPKNHGTGQLRYITWLGDVHWFTRQNPTHRPYFDTWRRLFSPITDSWHATAASIFEFGWIRHKSATYYARGLALDDDDRRPLMTIKTSRQSARKRQLDNAEDMRHAITSHAMVNPDKSGKRTPGDIARRRYRIWKTYVLADQSERTATRMFNAIYGEEIERRNFVKQLETIDQAWREFGGQ